MTAALLLLVVSLQNGLAVPPSQISDPYEAAERRATDVAVAGFVIGAAGMGVTALSVAAIPGPDALGNFGVTALFAGTPMTAGGGLRARKLLQRRGAGVVPQKAGAASWAMWTGAFVTFDIGVAMLLIAAVDDFTDTERVWERAPTGMALVITSGGLLAGAYTASVVQLVVNQEARRELGTRASVQPDRTWELGLAPTLGIHQVGAVAFGRF